MAETDAVKFWYEVVGLRRVKELVKGPLKGIVSGNKLIENIREQILVFLDGTILGTGELDVSPYEEISSRSGLVLPGLVSVGSVTGFRQNVDFDPEKEFGSEEAATTDLYDMVCPPSQTSESDMYDRLIEDTQIDTADDNSNIISGVHKDTTHVLGIFDYLFTRFGVFVDYNKRIDKRGEAAEVFLTKAMKRSGIPKSAYSVLRVVQRDKGKFSRGYGEYVLVGGDGYSLVFRPFNNIPETSFGKNDSWPAGTMIYTDDKKVNVRGLNEIISGYNSFLEQI